ncbi:MAG: helix-turn-helix domain-containing protein, partial [Bacteroidota bacterium]
FRLMVHTVLGEHERALDLLAEGIDRRVSMLVVSRIEPFLQPLHQYPRFQTLTQRFVGRGTPKSILPTGYPTKTLPTSKERAAFARLETYVREQRPYLEPQLSLRDLAERTGHHPNQLSHLINAVGERNFADFVNGYRLTEFQARATAGEARRLTVLGLAFDCGFNSKTVFNTYFKRRTGMTPTDYLRAQG